MANIQFLPDEVFVPQTPQQSTPLTAAQKAILAEYLDKAGDLLIDAFIDAKVTNSFSFTVEDLGEKMTFRVTVKRTK